MTASNRPRFNDSDNVGPDRYINLHYYYTLPYNPDYLVIFKNKYSASLKKYTVLYKPMHMIMEYIKF